MKKSLYNRIRNTVLGLFFILMPFFFCATTLAGPTWHKADCGSINLKNQAVSSFPLDIPNNNHSIISTDSTLNPIVGSSQYTLQNLLNRNRKSSIIKVNALAAPPTIVCPGNKIANTDPGFCRASLSGLAATISDPDGDITTLTWTMNGATIAASPISGINNILGSYNFNKGVTSVTYRVTDALGSSVTCSFTVTVSDKEIPTIICPPNANLTIPSCASITDPISFSPLSLSDNCGISSFSSNPILPAQFPLGSTSVIWTANDVNGNSSQCTQVVNVVNEAAMKLTTSSTPVSCFGGNNGTVTVAVTDGSPAYTYSWNTVPVQTTSTATNLLPGTYTVTVTDFYGCTATASATVTQPGAILTVAVASQVNVACFGTSTGSVTVAGIGGTPAYQYSIDGILFQGSPIFSGLVAGIYTITIKDSRNCTNTTSATISQPATDVSVLIVSQTNVTCVGTATGSVTVSGNGGTPPYQYSIDGGAFQVSGTFNNLIAGTHSISVRDANNCTHGLSVIITQSATLLAATITGHTNILCSGGSTGSATVSASGGASPYTYSWNSVPVQTTATATNLTARAYVVTVRDAAGCVVTASVTLTQPAPIVVSITSTNVACFGDLTGTATASASGGKPPYTYAWLTTPIQTAAKAINLGAGTYTVAVFDSSGCYKAAFVTITQPAAKLLASITNQVNVVCAGSNTGSITVTGTGGTAPIQYNINGGAFQASGTFNNLAGGVYSLLAKDANGCTSPVSATITSPATVLTAAITSHTNVLCSGGSTGSATVTASGGIAPYTYSWNSVPVQTNATAINLTARAYIVTVRDAAGCSVTASITITQPSPLLVTTTSTNIACFGDLTGTATASASGGKPPYTYTWLTTPIQNSATATNLAAGVYTVAVFDSSGCYKAAFVTITQPAAKLIASITNQVNVVCAGSNTGSITVTGTGGTAPIQYNINGGAFQASGTFNNLAGGVYSLLAKDANGCTSAISATITSPAAALTAVITSHTNVLCSGGSTGSAIVAASGGTAPYIYSWNSVPVQTNATAINLTARAYTVTVRDAVGCTATASITITQPSPLLVTTTSTNIACFGDLTGTATASASGGKPPYTYTWLTTPIQNSATATNLAAGVYTVAVFDSSGCYKAAFVTITQPAAKLIASITNQVNVVCAGSNTGSITVTGTGGTVPIQYNINGGAFQASGTFNNLAGGVYSIIAKDANGCTSPLSATITSPAAVLTATITSSTNVLCSGGSTGSATVAASGGTAPYTYSWNSLPVQTTATASNLIAGNYIVTVKDASGCEATDTITLTEPSLIVLTSSKTDIACSGDSTGIATVLANGGLLPYTYAWTTIPVQTTSTASNLPAGTYTVTVTDLLGCKKSATVTITQPATKLIASITNQVNVACFGDTSGSITVTGSGGIAPIQYNINGGAFQASSTFSNLVAGAYTLIAKDANNCLVTIPAIITTPATVLTATITGQTNILCSGGSAGSATVTASGGSSPYTYSWNTVPVQTAATAINLIAGNYIVTVKDAAGCEKTANVTITEPTPLILTAIKTDVACFGESTGTATVQVSGGKPPYTYVWLTTPLQTTATVSNLTIGTYNVTVFDSLGCFKSTSVTITQPASMLTASVTDQLNVACAGNTGSITAAASGGIPPYQYNINGGVFQASGIFNNLSAGIYTIIAKDANNCTFNIPPATITEPANALHASITSQINELCVGDAIGSATVTALNGTAPYTYAWNTIPVQTSATASNLAAGNYIVITIDNMGCFVKDTAFITEPALALSASITDQVNFDCATGTNGSVTIAGIGGTPNYQYSIDGITYQVSGIFSNLPVGNYTLTVRDTNNCKALVPVEITIFGLIHAEKDSFITPEDTQLDENVMTNDQVLCNLPITVTANTSPQHGTVTVNADGTFTYIPVINYNGSDSFDYTITDFAGTSSTATVTITVDPVNDPPITLNDSITVKYNTPTSGNVLLNGHFDPDGTTLTANTTPLADPVNGTFVIAADGSFTYTPTLNYIGNDVVIISLCDAGIPLPSACTNDTLIIVVLPPNLPPVIVHENIGLCQDGSFTGTTSNGGAIFNGETDPENNLPLTINSIPVQDATHGTFTITDAVTGTFNYTPNSGYSGSDIVVVSICDSGIPVACSNDTIYIEILAPVVADAGLSQKLCNADIATLVGNSPGTAIGNWNFVSGPNTPTVTPSTGNVTIASGLIASLTPYVFGYSIDNGGCVTTDTMSVINYIPATPAYAGKDQEFCNATGNFTVTLEGNTPVNGTGTWSQLAGPTAANILDPTNPNSNVSDLAFGIYTFQWLITNGLCQDNADVVNISVSQSVIVNAGIDLSTCEAASVMITGSNVLNSTSLLWTTTGNGTFDDPTTLTPVYTPGSLDLTMGTVKLVLTAAANKPCTDAIDFTILTINKTPIANAGPDEGSICVGNSKTISLASASDYSTLQWSISPSSAGTLLNPETLNPTFTPAAGFSGTVILTLQAQGLGTCNTAVYTDDMTFDVNSSLVANAGVDQTILPGTTANLSGSAAGGTGFYSWSWQPAGFLDNALIYNPVTVALNADTTFVLTVLDITTGCTDEDSVMVFMYKQVIPIVAVGDHDSTLVNSSVTINVIANDKNPDGDPLLLSLCGNPSHGIVVLNSDNTITYTPYSDYEGEDEFCYQICSTVNPMFCADTVVQIHVKHPSLDDLHPYTGISPNQDGVNDVWKIRGIEKYPDNTVIIFNRWGDKLREFVNYNNSTHSWNGKNEHEDPLPDGTYFFILDVKEVGVLKGWIYIRNK